MLSISQLSGCCDKISDKSNLGKEGLVWLTGQVMDYPNRENIVLGPCDHWADHIHGRDAGREVFGCSAHFFAFYSLLSHEDADIQAALPTSVSPVWKVSSVTLDALRSTGNINSHVMLSGKLYLSPLLSWSSFVKV